MVVLFVVCWGETGSTKTMDSVRCELMVAHIARFLLYLYSAWNYYFNLPSLVRIRIMATVSVHLNHHCFSPTSVLKQGLVGEWLWLYFLHSFAQFSMLYYFYSDIPLTCSCINQLACAHMYMCRGHFMFVCICVYTVCGWGYESKWNILWTSGPINCPPGVIFADA